MGMCMEIVKINSGLIIINDVYNVSLTVMEVVFYLMNGLDGFVKKIVVFGDMLEFGD